MTRTVSIRVDEQVERELDTLARSAGSRNAAVVLAIHEAYRRRIYADMTAEFARLAADPAYRADVDDARDALGSDDDAW